MEGKIITQWEQIVGERFARLGLPEKITFPKGKKDEGTLYLRVTSSGYLLLHYAQDLILEQVNTFFGYKALVKLHMTHGFTPPTQHSPQEKKSLSPNEKAWLEGQIQAVSDLELKECLESLGNALFLCSSE